MKQPPDSAPAPGVPPTSGLLSEDKAAAERREMRQQQLEAPGREVANLRVLAAIESIPRHWFVPENLRPLAYADRPLSIGFGQTISQPFIVAYMTAALNPEPHHRVLEIGTGSGYQAAVLSYLVAEVYSLEVVGLLARQARTTLAQLGRTNIHIRVEDGYHGWPEQAPFDGIVVTCAPSHLPPALSAQLKEGGRLAIPIGPTSEQTLQVYQKNQGQLILHSSLPVRFVPMTGVAQITAHPKSCSSQTTFFGGQ